MLRKTGRHALLEMLIAHGVEYVFGNPGTTELPLLDGLQDYPQLKYVLALQEASAVAMADEPVDQIDADVYTVAKTKGVGLLIGSMSRVGIGVGPGVLMGAGLGLAKVLFTRGDEISLPVGTRVEMVLQRPLTVAPQP